MKTAVPPVMFESDENLCRGLVRQINDHDTSILIMGIGAPKSEIWVDTPRNKPPPCWALCVGQATRIACGLTMRAPILVRRLNCEWLWRVCQEPRRLWWRDLRGFTRFLWRSSRTSFEPLVSRLAWRQADAPPERVAPVHRASRLRRQRAARCKSTLSPLLPKGCMAQVRWTSKRADRDDHSPWMVDFLLAPIFISGRGLAGPRSRFTV